jgi:hypothetical protein
MRRVHRVILIAAILPLTLGGCGTFWDSANNVSDRFQDMLVDFNPFGTAKKPLPGERRAVFPEGVPGVQQGVPPELMRGNQQAGEALAQPPPPPEPEPKAKTKKVAKTKTQPRAQAPATPKSDDPPEDGVWPPPPGNRGQ